MPSMPEDDHGGDFIPGFIKHTKTDKVFGKLVTQDPYVAHTSTARLEVMYEPIEGLEAVHLATIVIPYVIWPFIPSLFTKQGFLMTDFVEGPDIKLSYYKF